VIAANDRVIAPTLQETFAEEMNATSITLSSSHVAMLSLVLPLFGPRSLDSMYSYRVDWNEPIRC
jgi:hypothetical protein